MVGTASGDEGDEETGRGRRAIQTDGIAVEAAMVGGEARNSFG